jgi:hypothetical protein
MAAFGALSNHRLAFMRASPLFYRNRALWGSHIKVGWSGSDFKFSCRGFPSANWLRERKSIVSATFVQYCGRHNVSGDVEHLAALHGSAITSLTVEEYLTTDSVHINRKAVWHYLKELPLTHLSMTCRASKRRRWSLDGICAALPRLQILEWKNLDDESELYFLRGLTELRHLGLAPCPMLREIGTENLSALPLESLRIGKCGFVRNLDFLRGMRLRKLALCDFPELSDFSALGTLPLESLRVSNCRFLRTLDFLRGMRLRELDLRGCQELSDYSALRTLPLTRLVLRTDAEDKHMANIVLLNATLEHLDMEWGEITDATLILFAVYGLRLKTLNLAGCGKITGAGLARLVGMPLETLDLRCINLLIQECPPTLRHCALVDPPSRHAYSRLSDTEKIFCQLQMYADKVHPQLKSRVFP